MDTDVVLSCYRGGIVGLVLKRFAFSFPTSIWLGLLGLGLYTHECYLQYIGMAFWFALATNFAATEIIAQYSPNPACYQSYAMPCFEAQMLYQYIVIVAFHRIYWHLPILRMVSIARLLLASIILPGVLVWSGNYSLAQVAAGAAFGMFTGAFWVAGLFLFWIDRFPIVIAGNAAGSWFGYFDIFSASRSPIPYESEGEGSDTENEREDMQKLTPHGDMRLLTKLLRPGEEEVANEDTTRDLAAYPKMDGRQALKGQEEYEMPISSSPAGEFLNPNSRLARGAIHIIL